MRQAHMREPLPYWATHQQFKTGLQSFAYALAVFAFAALFGIGFAVL